MSADFQHWLAPPIFPADESKTRRAGLLNMILWVSIATALLILIGNWIGGQTPLNVTLANAVLVLVCLGLRTWMYSGRVQLASGLLLAFGISLATASIAQLGTIRTPSTTLYLLAIVVAGLLFDLRGILVVSGLSSLAVAGLILAENSGLLPNPDYSVTITQWTTYTAIFAATGSLMVFYIRTMRQALEQSNRELAERKRAEVILRESEKRFSAIFHATPTQIAITRYADGVYLDANESFLDSTGFSRAEVIGHASAELDNWADPAELAHMLSLLEAHGRVRNFEARLRRKAGENLDLLISADMIQLNGEPCILSSALDITQRKQVEAKLRESEERYRRIVDTAQEGIWMIDADSRTSFANRKLAEMLGYTLEELPGMALFDFMDQEARLLAAEYIERRKQGIAEQHDFRFRRKDGSEFWAIVETNPLFDENGAYLGGLAMVTDITARRQTEFELRQTQKFLQKTIDCLSAHIAILNEKGVILAVNQRWRQFGQENDLKAENDGLGTNYLEICRAAQGEEAQIGLAVAEAIETLLNQDSSGAEKEFEYPCHSPSEQRWFIEHLTAFEENNKRRVVVAHENITERKRAEAALRESEELHRIIMENILDPLFITNDSGDFTFICTNVSHFLGYTQKEVQTMGNIAKLVGDHLFDPEQLRSAGQIANIERTMVNKWGKASVYLITVKQVQIRDGTRLYVCREVTEHKRAEEALAKSEARYRLIAENTADVIWILDPAAGKFKYVSPSVEKMRGYTPAEVMARDVSEAFTPAAFKAGRDQFAKRLAEFLARGIDRESFVTQVDQRCKDGSIVHTEVITTYLLNDQGAVEIIGVSRDITERRRTEEVHQAAAAEERQRLARELHDTVSQTIYSASLIAESLPRLLARSPALLPDGLRDLQRLTRGALAEMRTLLFELRPASIEQVRLNDLLRQLANSLMGRTRLEVRVEIVGNHSLPLDVRLAFYRTAQEALNNILKHAEARHVTLRRRDLPPLSGIIEAQSLPGVELTIHDDGRGFDRQRIQPGHHGLDILRERSATIGAQLMIISQPGKGTEVTLTWRGNFSEEQGT